MLQHNEETYSRDCEAVAQFYLDSSQIPLSKCLYNCSRIADALSAHDREVALSYCQVIKKHLDLDEDIAFLLAILVAHLGYVQSEDNLILKSRLEKADAQTALERMLAAGLINTLDDSTGIILTGKAIKMLREDNTMENIIQSDFIDILRQDSDADDPYDDDILSTITRKIKGYAIKNPESRMGKFFEENNMSELSHSELRQFVLLCRHFVLDFTNGFRVDRGNAGVKSMINRGWAVLYAAQGDYESELIKQNNMLLSVNVCKKLFKGEESIIDFTSIMGQTRLKKWSEIEEKPLFYNEDEMPVIRRLYQMSREEEYQRISAGLREYHLKVAVSGILYGGPGTGKTELAKQIARTTQRNLLIVDTSKLVGSYVGESERNYRDLFRNFRYIEAVSSRAPIMFMDEADGFLGKRIAGAGNSRDRYVNIIQNIILEELNDFEGILLATTNLASNLDDAMDRRFLVKIQFDIPDENTRKKIWKSRLPKVTDEDLAVVARDFSFSGGHIDNVATQAIIESIMNGTNTVTLESLIKYCKDEDSFTNKDSRKRIGF